MAVFQRYMVSHAQRDCGLSRSSSPRVPPTTWCRRGGFGREWTTAPSRRPSSRVANRHDALRTTYRERDGAVWAEVHDRVDGLRLTVCAWWMREGQPMRS